MTFDLRFAIASLLVLSTSGSAHASWFLPAEMQTGPRWGMSRGPQPIPLSKTYEEVRKFMQDIVVAYPRSARVFELGDSDSGRKIEGIMLGDLPVIQQRMRMRQQVVSNLV